MPRSAARRRAQAGRLDPPAPHARVDGVPAHPLLPAISQSPSIPGVAILPLRAFLGVTFIYAGLQKIMDPGFFHSGSSTYIGSQIQGFSQHSPIAFLFHWFAQPFPVLVGVLTILTEIIVGLLVLTGWYTRPAALAGLALNLVFFLSASWNVYPYFLGSDIVFVMCWLTLLLTGPGAFAIDTARLARQPTTVRAGTDGAVIPIHGGSGTLSRSQLLAALAGTAAVVVLGLLPRPRLGGSVPVAASRAPTSPQSTSPTSSGFIPPPGAKKVGNISQIPVDNAATLTDPKSGDPAIIVRMGHSSSQVYAYDAVCTHAGCTVQYDPQYKLLVCPCHGAAFDPTKHAEVVGGPAPSPLTEIPMKIDASGNLYVV